MKQLTQQLKYKASHTCPVDGAWEVDGLGCGEAVAPELVAKLVPFRPRMGEVGSPPPKPKRKFLIDFTWLSDAGVSLEIVDGYSMGEKVYILIFLLRNYIVWSLSKVQPSLGYVGFMYLSPQHTCIVYLTVLLPSWSSIHFKITYIKSTHHLPHHPSNVSVLFHWWQIILLRKKKYPINEW